MNMKDIRINAQLILGLTVEMPIAIRYVNEYIERLAEQHQTAAKKKTMTIQAGGIGYVDLPDDLLSVTRMLDEGGNIYNGFIIDHNLIRFMRTGTYTMEYTAYPDLIGAEQEKPDIPRAFYHACAYYIAAKERARLFSDEDQDYMLYLEQADQMAKEADKTLRTKKKTRRFVKAPYWG